MNVLNFFNRIKWNLLICLFLGCGNVNSGVSVKENSIPGKTTEEEAAASIITVRDAAFSGKASKDISVDLSTLVDDFSSSKKYIYTIVKPPTTGFISIFNELLVYTPIAEGSDTVQFKVASGDANSNIATISYTITPDSVVVGGGSPLALKDGSINLVTNEAGSLDLKTLVQNYDASKTYNFIISQSPTSGQATLNFSSLTYTPFPDVVGTDVILVKAGDGLSTSNVAAINIKIEDISTAAPKWGQLTIEVPKGNPVTVDLRTLLQAPHPFAGKVYTFTVLQNPKNGSVELSGTNLTFTAIQFGVDTSMRILVQDDLGQSTEGKFTLNITP